MYIKIKFEKVGDLVLLSQFTGMAPCGILALNNVKSEHELVGREILIKPSIVKLIRNPG